MKLSLLGMASYLDRTTGGPCPPVDTTLFQPIAFVKRFVNKNSCGLVIAVGSLISLLIRLQPIPINGALSKGPAAPIAVSALLSNAEQRSAE